MRALLDRAVSASSWHGAGPLQLLGVLTIWLGVVAPSLAQSPPPDLAHLSIEDLMKIEITSAGRKEQRVSDVAAAVYVITQDDIQHSGLTALPELLRLAPGVSVARLDSSRWAVTIRGFNNLYANKLLVLVDGRSVYTRLFSGATWDTNDLIVDDIDRIEVIRGPGAAMWGANAVNGVINIVTKSAADTTGWLARLDAGYAGQQGNIRYGGTVGETPYRIYAQWTDGEPSLIVPGVRADDWSRTAMAGFRSDWRRHTKAFTLDGRFTVGRGHGAWVNLDPLTALSKPIRDEESASHGGHLLGRWTYTGAGGHSLKVQSFLDISSRREPIGDYDRRTFDVDTQYRASVAARHDLVVGAGFRYFGEHLNGRDGALLVPAKDRAVLVSGFIQDEIALFDNRFAVTLGSQMQYDSGAGAGIQPTARVMWKGLPNQRLWAATSRALRTPSLSERNVRLDYPPAAGAGGLPVFATLAGNPATRSEQLIDAEAGYRIEMGTIASLDVTGFVGRYSHLTTRELATPRVEFEPSPRIVVASQMGNELAATTRGLEVAAIYSPLPAWRLDAGYTLFDLSPHLSATSRDPDADRADGNAPGRQWRVRSSFSPGTRATLNITMFHVGPLARLQIAAYTRADATFEWHFSRHLSVMAIGQNLLDAAHFEFGGADSLIQAMQVPRSAGLRVRWTFPQ